MLRPIPSRILTHSAILKVCTGQDEWQTPVYQSYTLHRICVQNDHKTLKQRDNTEVRTTGIAFYDARLSTPHLDLEALQAQSDANGHPMRLVFKGVDHVILGVDNCIDDEGKDHHTELMLD